MKTRLCQFNRGCFLNRSTSGITPPKGGIMRCGDRPRAAVNACSPHYPGRSGSPDPDPFVIWRSQTTEGETHIVTMERAGDRPPRYDKKTSLWASTCFYRHVGPKGPKTPPLDDAQRGGQAPALREHRDQEVSPTGKKSRYETPSFNSLPFPPPHPQAQRSIL